MKTVLFLGAGFSAPFGYPTMNQFMAFASDNLESDDLRFFMELVIEARRANSMLESSPTNLEDVLSFAVMGDRLGLNQQGESKRGPRLQVILQKVYSKLGFNYEHKFWDRYKPFADLLGFKNGSDFRDLTVLTTNYDLNIECALSFFNVPVCLPFEYDEPVGKRNVARNLYTATDAPRDSFRLKLHKLHGSVNWFRSDLSQRLLVNGLVVATQDGGTIPEVCARNFECDSSPEIIPPSFLKPDIGREIAGVWAGAASALSEAEVVIFVGYRRV